MNEIKTYTIEKISSILQDYEQLEVETIVSDKAYSIEFRVTINGKKMQCYQMVDDGMLNEKLLDATFKEIATYIRSSKDYKAKTVNEFSFSVTR